MLARSSAPCYVLQDSEQNMDEAAISQLIVEGVRDIISQCRSVVLVVLDLTCVFC